MRADNATGVPRTNDGVVEMIRQIKVAKDVAVKARTAAMITLKAVSWPPGSTCVNSCNH